jgi:hypothetical protein
MCLRPVLGRRPGCCEGLRDFHQGAARVLEKALIHGGDI